jgi:hypothetical protein
MQQRPPSLAIWLTTLFTPSTQADAVLGDLSEEFSQIASTAGRALARRWYWRQSVKTIAHFYAAGLRVKPGLIMFCIAMGFLLHCWGNGLSYRMSGEILSRYLVYKFIPPHTFALLYTIAIPLLLDIGVGYVVAVAAKNRGMVVAVTLSLVVGTMQGLLLVQFLTRFPQWNTPYLRLPFMSMVANTLIAPVMIAIGGALQSRGAFRKSPCTIQI